jgi:hypothetical protein
MTQQQGAERRNFGPTWPEVRRDWGANPNKLSTRGRRVELLASLTAH